MNTVKPLSEMKRDRLQEGWVILVHPDEHKRLNDEWLAANPDAFGVEHRVYAIHLDHWHVIEPGDVPVGMYTTKESA